MTYRWLIYIKGIRCVGIARTHQTPYNGKVAIGTCVYMPVFGYSRDTSSCYALPLWQVSALKAPSIFTLGHSSRTGRCRRSGRILCRSRGARSIRSRFVNTANGVAALTPPSIITSFFFAPGYRQPRMFALMCGSLGHWFVVTATTQLRYLSYVGQAPMAVPPSFSAAITPRLVAKLAEPHTQASIISLQCSSSRAGKTVWCRAIGSTATLLAPIFFREWSVFLLPSRMLKILPASVSFFTSPACSANMGPQQYRGAAGMARRVGKYPTVRGTVKNACDHPNGGRSRALRLPQTPWATPAKKPRKPKYLRD